MDSNNSQVKIYTDYSDTTFIGKFNYTSTLLPLYFRYTSGYFHLDSSSSTDFKYILETWTASCQPPEGYECLVCDQQYLVLRYWNEKLKTQFARHKKIKPEETSSKSSFWFRSSKDLTFNLYIRNKNVHYLITESATSLLVTLIRWQNKDIFVTNIDVTDGVCFGPRLLAHPFELCHNKLTLLTVLEAHTKVCISHRFDFAADPFSQRC